MATESDPKLLAAVERSFAAHAEWRGPKTVDDAMAGWTGRKGLRLPPDVWGALLRRLATDAVLSVRRDFEDAATACESPIEELLFLAICVVGQRRSYPGVYLRGTAPDLFRDGDGIAVEAQVPIGRYRVDLQVTSYRLDVSDDHTSTHRGVVLVECDGHDFHERTKQQASHDKRKDRELQRLGFVVFRYTGSDVWNDCMAAAEEVVEQAMALALKNPPVLRLER